MEENDKIVMRKMHVQLVRNLDTTGLLLDYLYQENILAEDDVEKIKAKKTSKKRAEKLLKILKKRRGGFKMLIKALIHTKIQDFLGYEILKNVTWSEKDKKVFDQELIDEGIDEQQKLKTELEAAKREVERLKMMLKEQGEKFQRNQSNSRSFLNFFRRSKERQNKASNSKNLQSTPRNERLYSENLDLRDAIADPFEVIRSLQSSNSATAISQVPDPFEFVPRSRRSTNSATAISQLRDTVVDPFEFVPRSRRSTNSATDSSFPFHFDDSISSAQQSTKSSPVPCRKMTNRRSSSRTGSIVSSASLRLRNVRNAVASVRWNQDVGGYTNLDREIKGTILH